MMRCVRAISVFCCVLLAACSKDPQVAAREFVRSGDAFVAQGKRSEAIIQYRNAVQQDPLFGEARRKLGETLMLSGDLSGAISQVIRAADLLQNDAQAQLRAGQMLLAAGQFMDAQARAEKALALQPQLVDAQVLRANALAGLNRLDDAVTAMEEAIRSAPDRASTYANLGLMHLFNRDRQAAEGAFKSAVAAAPESVDARLALAQFYWVTQRAKEAEVEFAAALKLAPNNLLANRALSYFYLGTGRPKEAEPLLQKIAASTPNATGKLTLADYYVAARRLPEAKRILEALRADGKDGAVAATLRLAGLGFWSGDLPASNRLVDEVLDKEPRNIDALLAKSRLLLQEHRLDDAIVQVEKAVGIDARNASVQFSLGAVRAAKRRDAEAIAAFAEALKLDPKLATAEVEMAKIHLRAGRLRDAQQFAEASLVKMSGLVEGHLVLVDINLRKGDQARAEAIVRKLAKALPNEPRVLTRLAQVEAIKGNTVVARQLFQRVNTSSPDNIAALAGLVALDLKRKPEEARARLAAALVRDPRNSELLLLAARAASRMSDNDTAVARAKEAIAADPTNLEAYTLLGGLFYELRRLDEGIAVYRALAKEQPGTVGPPTMIGILLEIQGKHDDAREYYNQALALDSRAAVAANNLAWLYADTNTNLDKAVELAKVAKAGLPDTPQVDDTLGWAYFRKADYVAAQRALLEAVRKDPKNASYFYHLGLVYAATGDKKNARSSLETALTLDPKFENAPQARDAIAGL